MLLTALIMHQIPRFVYYALIMVDHNIIHEHCGLLGKTKISAVQEVDIDSLPSLAVLSHTN